MKKLLILLTSLLFLAACSDGQRERMHDELLRARKMNKEYVDFTTDSVMKEVASWYDRHGTSNERMEANYLKPETTVESMECADELMNSSTQMPQNPPIMEFDEAPRFISSPEGTVVDLKSELRRIDEGRFYSFHHDNSIYYNKFNALPSTGAPYKEFVVPTPSVSGVNGVRVGQMRIIFGVNGERFFTPDHYETFFKITFGF